MTDPISDRTAPGTWRIADARPVIGALFIELVSNGYMLEHDARFIVYADRTIEAYEAVAEAARQALADWDTHGTETAVWVVHTKMRAALAALDTAKEAGR